MKGLLECPLCGAGQGTRLFDAADPLSSDRFEVRRCPSCNLVYVSPRPSEEHMRAYYPDGYFGKRHPVLKDFFMGVRVAALPQRTPGRILDIGCGRGDFLTACRGKGWEVMGVEQADAPIMELRREIGLEVVATTDIAAIPDASFDAVTMWHVFEHMVSPRGMLREVARMLRPGGVFVAEVPNFGSWQARMGPRDWFHLDVPRHLVHFERATLARMLEAEGFTCEEWSTFSVEYDAYGMMQTLLNRVSDTPNWLFQHLIGQGGGGTLRDVVAAVLLTPILAPLSWIVSIVAPAFGRGGVLRVVARKAAAGAPPARS
jgi:2-polyprenyl-3-methyl-5-hydroxy-6-metoxy-1,4-benzoquinol methylase